MVALFLLGWAANVSLFARYRVDYAAVLHLSKEELATPRLLLLLAVLIAAALSMARAAAFLHGATSELIAFVLLCYAAALLAIGGMLPRWLAKQSRWREPLVQALWRCLWPDGSREIPFVEVLVADGLTSLSKLFFDITMGSCIVASSRFDADMQLGVRGLAVSTGFPLKPYSGPSAGSADLATALDQCSRSPLPYAAWALPFLIRARQCIITSRHAPDALSRDLQRVNLAKYLSALPVVFFAMCHAKVIPGVSESMISPEDFEVLWALAAVANSVFSFLWDLVMDWGLLHLTPGKPGNFGLRPVLLFPGPAVLYYFAVFLNFVGRTLWSLRWSEQATVFLGAFFLSSVQQSAEVIRRCLWSVIRVEWQCICKGKFPRTDKSFPV
mmetsp:Transcript_18717/g.42142  ORF Transcript_18717/g.42142 Transcript_18717/m.42142 type:complete len:385 (+) Transcript_18717:2-1156(+)